MIRSQMFLTGYQAKEAAADPVLDTLGAAAYSSVVPPIGPITKYISPDDVNQAQDSLRKGSAAAALVPFYNSYRGGKAVSVLNEKLHKEYGDKHPKRQMLGEDIGVFTSPAVPAGLGMAIKGYPGMKAGLAGSGLAMLVAAVSAMVANRRTYKEQAEHDTKGATAGNLLVPGVAAYNVLKRLGASRTLTE